MSKPRDIPSIPESVPEDVARPMRAMREAIQRLMGTRGSGLDAALTSRSGGTSGSSTIIIGGGSTGGGGGDTPDLTPPPTVSDLAVLAGFSEVIISWTGITYTQGHGNRQTLIYAVKKDPSDPTMPLFGEATLVAVAPQALTVISVPSELNTRWHVWAKFESNDGVLSVSPAGGTNGVQGTTGQDIAQLLEILTGKITSSQLFIDLATPIGRIGELEDNAAADALRVALALHDEQTQRAADLLAVVEDRGTAIVQTQQLIDEGDAQLAQQITTLTAKVDTNQTTALAAVEQEATTRASADSAEAALRDALAVQMRGTYAGTDLALVTTGLIASERNARVADTAASVLRLDALEASVDTPTTGLLARATSLESAVADIEGDILVEVSRIDALEASVNTPSTGLLARATALEAVTTNVTSGNAALATRASALEATVNNPTTGVSATAAALDVVETLVNSGTQGNVALATRTSTLEVSVNSPTIGNNPTYAALQTEASVRASETGDLFGQLTVKIDLAGYVTGYGLASTVIDGAPSSAFLVRADQFAVVPPVNYAQSAAPGSPSVNQLWLDTDDNVVRRWTGSAWEVFDILPFVVQTTPTTEGGVTIAAGVYIDAANIINLNAQYGRFASLVADDIAAADITAAQITSGTLSAARIGAGTIDATKLNVATLNAITANTGALTVSGALTMSTSGHIKGGQTDYATGSGFFLGYSGGAYKFSLGSGAAMMTWDGSTLTIPAATITGTLTTAQIQVGAVSVSDGSESSFSATGFSSTTSVSRTDNSVASLATSGKTVDVIGTVRAEVLTSAGNVDRAYVSIRARVDSSDAAVASMDFFVPVFSISGGFAINVVAPLVMRSALAAGNHSFGARITIEFRASNNAAVACSGTWSSKFYITAKENKV